MSSRLAKIDPDSLAACDQGDVVMLADATPVGGTVANETWPRGTIVKVAWQGQHSTFVERRVGQEWERPTPVSSRSKIAKVVEEWSRPPVADDGEVVDPMLRGTQDQSLFGGRK